MPFDVVSEDFLFSTVATGRFFRNGTDAGISGFLLSAITDVVKIACGRDGQPQAAFNAQSDILNRKLLLYHPI
ncbi:MAG: hypothetical protein PVH87_25720 [Desulfobacteraceae bacterium]|jgi:hypothetical protein